MEVEFVRLVKVTATQERHWASSVYFQSKTPFADSGSTAQQNQTNDKIIGLRISLTQVESQRHQAGATVRFQTLPLSYESAWRAGQGSTMSPIKSSHQNNDLRLSVAKTSAFIGRNFNGRCLRTVLQRCLTEVSTLTLASASIFMFSDFGPHWSDCRSTGSTYTTHCNYRAGLEFCPSLTNCAFKVKV